MTPGERRWPPSAHVFVAGVILALSAVAAAYIPLLPQATTTLGIAITDVGVFTTVFAAGRLLVDLPAGRLIDRRGSRRILATAAFGLGIGAAVLASAGNRLTFLAAAALLGAGSATANTSGMAFFSASSTIGNRGIAMSFYAAGLLGGQSLGPALSGALETVTGWRTTMWLVAAMAFMVAAMVARAHPTRPGLRPVRAGTGGTATDVALSGGSRWILGFAAFSVSVALIGVGVTLVPVLGAVEHGLSPGQIGAALGAAGVARLGGSMLGGYVADHYSRKAALIPGLLVQVLGLALLGLTAHVVGWVAGTVVMSLGSYGVVTSATILGDAVERSEMGRALGRYRFAADLGFVGGPAVTTFFLARSAPNGPLFVAIALLLASAVLVATLVPETYLGHK